MIQEPYLICRATSARYSTNEPRWRADGGGLLDLEWTPRLDPARVHSRPATLWRYREALPVRMDEHIVTLGEGFTPLVVDDLLGRRVHLKLESLFPTGSYKDRGASVLVSKTRELGVRRVVEDSSGNAGAAIAAYCARAGIECDIYVPASASSAKKSQIACFGANLHAIEGSREDVSRAVLHAAESVYYASHVWNPYFFHGTKTFAYEVVEQLGWRSPDAIVLPAGNGTLLIGTYLGLRELLAAGIISKPPRLIAVQAAGCAPLHARWSGREMEIQPTIAEGVAIAAPARTDQCIEAVRETGGAIVAVSEEQIRDAHALALRRGYCIEPTSATAIAALRHEARAVETVVVALTGHGLKSPEKLSAKS